MPLFLASLGELIPFDLLNFGTAGVSKADFRFAELFDERCRIGVFGTTPSILYSHQHPSRTLRLLYIHAQEIIALHSAPWCSICAPLVHATNVGFPSRFALQHLLYVLLECSARI